MRKIITAVDIARVDKKESVSEWIAWKSEQFVIMGILGTGWNGKTMGKAVPALISNGRAVALCPVDGCNGAEYVAPGEPFFCLRCGNGGTGTALPVKFPKDWDEICEALLAREVVFAGSGHMANMAFNMRPRNPSLRRDWAPRSLKGHQAIGGQMQPEDIGASAEQLRKRNEDVRGEQ